MAGNVLQARQCDNVRIYYLQYDTAGKSSNRVIRHFKNEKETGASFAQRFLGISLGTGKKHWRLAGTSPVTIPEATAGHNSVPVLLSFLKWRIVKDVGLVIGV